MCGSTGEVIGQQVSPAARTHTRCVGQSRLEGVRGGPLRRSRRCPPGADMTLPLLGPLTLSGFAHAWFFLFLLVVLAMMVLYIVVLRGRRRRVLRFANME